MLCSRSACIAVVLANLLIGACTSDTDSSAGPVALESLPEPAQEAIRRVAGDRDLLELEASASTSTMLYEAEWIEDGYEAGLLVNAAGEILLRLGAAAEIGEEHDDEETEGERESSGQDDGDEAPPASSPGEDAGGLDRDR